MMKFESFIIDAIIFLAGAIFGALLERNSNIGRLRIPPNREFCQCELTKSSESDGEVEDDTSYSESVYSSEESTDEEDEKERELNEEDEKERELNEEDEKERELNEEEEDEINKMAASVANDIMSDMFQQFASGCTETESVNSPQQNKKEDEEKDLVTIILSLTQTNKEAVNIISRLIPSVNPKGEEITPIRDNIKQERTLTDDLVEQFPEGQDPGLFQFETNEGEEIANIFEDEYRRQKKDMSEILEMGRSVGEEPVAYYSRPGGGYATVGEIKEKNNASVEFHKEKRLKRADELEIMNTFNNIRGINYHQAFYIVQGQGYSLHPIYINNGVKYPNSVYSGTVIGVSIEDDNFDYIEHNPSNNATISSIVDVGGQDERDRGKIAKI